MTKEKLPGNRVEGLLDTNVGLCAGLQELDSKLVCKGLTLILGDHLWGGNKKTKGVAVSIRCVVLVVVEEPLFWQR